MHAGIYARPARRRDVQKPNAPIASAELSLLAQQVPRIEATGLRTPLPGRFARRAELSQFPWAGLMVMGRRSPAGAVHVHRALLALAAVSLLAAVSDGIRPAPGKCASARYRAHSSFLAVPVLALCDAVPCQP